MDMTFSDENKLSSDKTISRDIIDFTNCKTRKKSYEGANGNKICIIYDNNIYMLKFPMQSRRNKDISYLNSCVSEYLGCHIFETFDIPVQETILGTYTTNENTKIVVACKDFTEQKYTIQNFASEKNKLIDSANSGYGTELSSILEAIDKKTDFDSVKLKDFFWNMFIVDSLIANWDRHNGNWGFLYDIQEDSLSLAPVFDCGSSMFPSADEDTMKNILNDENELKIRIYERPNSAILINNQRINYHSFINSLQNEDCNKALKNIYEKYDSKKINKVIDETPFITDIQKQFYSYMIEKRKEFILEPAYKNLLKRDKLKQDVSLER